MRREIRVPPSVISSVAGERRRQAEPGAGDHPRSSESRSTSSASRRRCSATTRPSPTHTSDAATAITASAKIWPAPFADVPGERDQREVRAVQHDLEREQDDQRVAPHEHAERADPEEEGGDAEVPGDRRAEHQVDASSSARFVCEPRITPPTAATSSTIDVISNASRWSVRNRRPIQPGEPNVALTCSLCDEPVTGLQRDHDDDLEEDRAGGEHRGDRLPARAARPRRLRTRRRRTRSRTGTSPSPRPRRRAPARRRRTRPRGAGRAPRAIRGCRSARAPRRTGSRTRRPRHPSRGTRSPATTQTIHTSGAACRVRGDHECER